jgi:hypothetical protein
MNCLKRRPILGPWTATTALVVALAGGCGTPSPHTTSRNYGLRPDLPVDPPREHGGALDECTSGGQLFAYYCGSCHNARALGERPFSNYHVVVTHMRDPAYLTGKEYRQIMMFLRRWHDVGPPTPSVEPSPKRLVFSQPIAELRGESRAPGTSVAPPPPTGAGPWQPGGADAAAGRQAGAAPPAPVPGPSGAAGTLPPLPELPGGPAPIH